MTFKFYHYTRNKKFIAKTPYLTDPKTIVSTKVAGDQDLENPVLTITSSGTSEVASYNYCYIQDWNRYYFILKRNWLASDVMQIWLQEDYRYTARTLIQAQTGFCRYSGLGDTNLIDSRVAFNPQAVINRFNIERDDDQAQYSANLYCLRFYSASPFITGESPSPADYVGTPTGENAVFLSESSLEAFFGNYATLSEANRVAVGKSIIGISYLPMPGYINSNARTVTGIRIDTPFTSAPIDIGLTSSSPGLDYARLIYSPLLVGTAITPVVYHAYNNIPGTAQRFNHSSRFWELRAVYTLYHPGIDMIEIDPSAYGKSTDFTITYQVGYEPFSDQYIVNLFPDVLDGKYTPIIRKNKLTVPFMVDNSLQQTDLTNITSVLREVSTVSGGLSSIIAGAGSGSAGAVIGGAASIAGNVINAGMNAERVQLAEQIGYSVIGLNGIAMYYPQGIDTSPHLYQAYKQPVSTPWGYKGIPDGHWRSLLTLDETGYAEIDLDEIDGNIYNYTDNELENIKAVLSEGVIFNELP